MKHFIKMALIAGLSVVALCGSCKKNEPPIGPNQGGKGKGEQPTPPPRASVELDHLIVEEVFYTSSPKKDTRKVNPYEYDVYIKIHNPTKQVAYLDGMLIALTELSCNRRLEGLSEPDKLQTHVPIKEMIQFPGSGQQYKIEPGKSIVLTPAAYNHQQLFSEALDLSSANFEIYTQEQMSENIYDNQGKGISENPQVPNMIYVYSDSQFLSMSSTRIGKLRAQDSEDDDDDDDEKDKEGEDEDDDEKYNDEGEITKGEDIPAFSLNKNTGGVLLLKAKTVEELKKVALPWNYTYTPQHHVGSGKCLLVPNDLVVDAVAICANNEYKWNIFNKSLDAGFKGVMTSMADAFETYAKKSIHRKHDGKNYLDNNNSTIDFEVRAKASLAQ